MTPETVKTFVEEVLVVKDLRHPNLLTPMGVVLQPSSTPQVVMTYMKYKELNKFLRQEQVCTFALTKRFSACHLQLQLSFDPKLVSYLE